MKNKNEEYEALKKKALEQFKTGQPLLVKYGAFAPLLKQFLESALESEMEEHLDESERSKGNRRNGTSKKIVKSSDGSFELETPRDRESDFEPDIQTKACWCFCAAFFFGPLKTVFSHLHLYLSSINILLSTLYVLFVFIFAVLIFESTAISKCCGNFKVDNCY